jgi:fused signal recognition particle receptor
MFRKLAFFCAFLALVVIVSGAYVRLSDAALTCPGLLDCNTKGAVDLNSDSQFEFLNRLPDTKKGWIDIGHRYVAGLLSLFVLLLSLLCWTEKRLRVSTITISIGLLFLVLMQSAVGLWVVTYKLMPILVTAHLLLGMLTFWIMSWLYLRTNPALQEQVSRNTGLRLLTLVAMLVLFLQIALGGWTSANYAGLACTDLPRCNGQWIPEANYHSAVDFLRGFESGYKGVLAFDAQIAIHWIHRAGAVVTFLVLSLVMLVATSVRYPKPVRAAGNLLSLALLVQITLGILAVRWSLPLSIGIAHNAVAALMMLPLIGIHIYARYGVADKEKLFQPEEAETAVVSAEVIEAETYVEPEPASLYLRLKSQLHKTRSGLGNVLATLPIGGKAIDQDLLDEIEAQLIMADVGVEAATDIIRQLTESLESHQLTDADSLSAALKQDLYEMLQPCSQPLVIPEQEGPFVILVVGVNGAGKTTSIGKLAKRLQVKGHSVMLAAGDTFRAAAVEQLQTWGDRNNIQVVAQHTGADSASVIFDAVQSAKAKNIDVLIADTAGRLHTKSNLMEELFKIKRIMAKLDETAPHEVLLVLDAGTGQNALSQAKLFNEAVKLTGIALTKLDGTAKGGVIFALAKQLGVPIRFIGIGEGIDDLQDFDAKNFVDALFVQD